MPTRGRLINFFAYFISGTAITCPLDDSHRSKIWCARIRQLSKDFRDTFYNQFYRLSLRGLSANGFQYYNLIFLLKLERSKAFHILPNLMLSRDIGLGSYSDRPIPTPIPPRCKTTSKEQSFPITLFFFLSLVSKQDTEGSGAQLGPIMSSDLKGSESSFFRGKSDWKRVMWHFARN